MGPEDKGMEKSSALYDFCSQITGNSICYCIHYRRNFDEKRTMMVIISSGTVTVRVKSQKISLSKLTIIFRGDVKKSNRPGRTGNIHRSLCSRKKNPLLLQ